MLNQAIHEDSHGMDVWMATGDGWMDGWMEGWFGFINESFITHFIVKMLNDK